MHGTRPNAWLGFQPTGSRAGSSSVITTRRCMSPEPISGPTRWPNVTPRLVIRLRVGRLYGVVLERPPGTWRIAGQSRSTSSTDSPKPASDRLQPGAARVGKRHRNGQRLGQRLGGILRLEQAKAEDALCAGDRLGWLAALGTGH